MSKKIIRALLKNNSFGIHMLFVGDERSGVSATISKEEADQLSNGQSIGPDGISTKVVEGFPFLTVKNGEVRLASSAEVKRAMRRS